jgi:outer membrane protein assembly factor BamB
MKSLIKLVGRIVPITSLGLMLAVAPMSRFAQAQSSTADWTQFHRNNMQRWNPYETTVGVNNVGSLQSKWKNPIGSYTPQQSSPAVVNGVVYFGSIDDHLYALNAGTGAMLWSFVTESSVYSSPAVVNGVVYFGTFYGHVYALDAGTGTKLWSFTTGANVVSSPAVANGVAYIGSDDNNVYALNARTGAKLWSYATGGRVESAPAVSNGIVYASSDDGNLYALNASTGAKLWSNQTLNHVTSSPAVANDVVYIGSADSSVYALNAATGAKLWSVKTFTAVTNSPAVANGAVYVSSDRNFYALNASTGVKLWSYATEGQVHSSAAVANGVVYFGSDDGNIYALNANTGAKLWSYKTGPFADAAYSSPTIVNGVVYFLCGDRVNAEGNTYAFAVGSADLFLRINPSTTTVHQGDLLTYAFPVWNLGPGNADFEVLNTQVPAGTIFDYIRISGTPGLGTCTTPPYQGTGQIVCHENAAMAPNTTWTVRLTVKVTAAAGTVITANAATMSDTPDPNMANNTATVSLKVQ